MKTEMPLIVAVVVTYHPDAAMPGRFAALLRECAHVIVVDNGSDPSERDWVTSDHLEVIALNRNMGLGSALNLGLRRAMELGYDWAVMFDQDSTPEPGMVAALWRTRERFSEQERVAVVGPRLLEEKVEHAHRVVVPHERCRWWFRRVSARERDLAGVAFVITSGALMNLRLFGEIGPMDDGLFIDFIDHDYCLRARARGYEILASAEAVLVHNMGGRREFTAAGKRVLTAFYPPLRLRYMFRNRCLVWRRYALKFPYWAAFDFIYLCYHVARILAFERGRFWKLAAILRGVWDGVCGRRGKIQ